MKLGLGLGIPGMMIPDDILPETNQYLSTVYQDGGTISDLDFTNSIYQLISPFSSKVKLIISPSLGVKADQDRYIAKWYNLVIPVGHCIQSSANAQAQADTNYKYSLFLPGDSLISPNLFHLSNPTLFIVYKQNSNLTSFSFYFQTTSGRDDILHYKSVEGNYYGRGSGNGDVFGFVDSERVVDSKHLITATLQSGDYDDVEININGVAKSLSSVRSGHTSRFYTNPTKLNINRISTLDPSKNLYFIMVAESLTVNEILSVDSFLIEHYQLG